MEANGPDDASISIGNGEGRLKVLVACEFSGTVRKAFADLGHDAYSCDYLPSLCYRAPKGKHIQGDVRPLLKQRWDLVIAHPPCTYLTNSGVQFLSRPGRLEAMKEGCDFFLECLNANALCVCVENPIPHGKAKAIIGDYTQVIQPYMFGHPESKGTALWLKGLPRLVPTRWVPAVTCRSPGEGGPSVWRKMKRSITYLGVALAMADQWGNSAPKDLFDD